VRDSPFAARSEIEEVELLVMVPLKVDPSLSVTVAVWPDPGPRSLAQPHVDVATVKTIAITSTFKLLSLITRISSLLAASQLDAANSDSHPLFASADDVIIAGHALAQSGDQ
jgi:hypothetical protein